MRRKLPVLVNFWMRWLALSATYTFPLSSTAMLVGPLNCPPRAPGSHFVRNVPQGGVHCAPPSLAVVSSNASARQLRMNGGIRPPALSRSRYRSHDAIEQNRSAFSFSYAKSHPQGARFVRALLDSETDEPGGTRAAHAESRPRRARGARSNAPPAASRSRSSATAARS